jgi:sulfatase maturation enzyme AslB (radical SAM superfamily)
MQKINLKNIKEKLVDKYKFSANYVQDYGVFREKIFNKTIIPYQVEFQPPPKSQKKICWLECPYCYGLSANDTEGDRMSKENAIRTMTEIAKGGVKKVIFAGYATDPLNCPFLEDLLEIAIDNHMIFGFNTKLIKASDRLIELLSRKDIMKGSYMSLSIDAGSNEVYNAMHAVKGKAKIYDIVLKNAIKVSKAREKGAGFDISAAYLVNIHNNEVGEVKQFIKHFKDEVCSDIIRFTFPQPPKDIPQEEGVVPKPNEKAAYKKKLSSLIESSSSGNTKVMIVDADEEHDIFDKPRTNPCFARFIYPTVGYDGWLYHCSQSSSPNFRPMALGDLNKNSFWNLFYDYDENNFGNHLKSCSKKMEETGCRCDRKMHVTNSKVISSKVFNDCGV